MHGGVLVQELLDSLPVNQDHLAPRLVLVADLVTLQQTGEVLRVAPVSTGQGEEQMKGPEVLELGVELELVLTPITAKVTTCLMPNETRPKRPIDAIQMTQMTKMTEMTQMTN